MNVGMLSKKFIIIRGHTFYIQKISMSQPHGGECTLDIIRNAIHSMIDYNDTIFREILSNIPEKQKELLYAIAKEGEAVQPFSASFIKRHI